MIPDYGYDLAGRDQARHSPSLLVLATLSCLHNILPGFSSQWQNTGFRFDYRESLYTIPANVADELQLVVLFVRKEVPANA